MQIRTYRAKNRCSKHCRWCVTSWVRTRRCCRLARCRPAGGNAFLVVGSLRCGPDDRRVRASAPLPLAARGRRPLDLLSWPIRRIIRWSPYRLTRSTAGDFRSRLTASICTRNSPASSFSLDSRRALTSTPARGVGIWTDRCSTCSPSCWMPRSLRTVARELMELVRTPGDRPPAAVAGTNSSNGLRDRSLQSELSHDGSDSSDRSVSDA